MSNYLVVLCTVPDSETAQHLAAELVKNKHAACVNIVPNIQSVYEWEGKVECAGEQLLIIKTERSRYPALESQLHALHPYDTPEIIAIPVDAGLPDYLKWIELATKG